MKYDTVLFMNYGREGRQSRKIQYTGGSVFGSPFSYNNITLPDRIAVLISTHDFLK